MPIQLRCYCGYVLTLRSSLAGKKIHCTECEKVLLVPVPGEKKSANESGSPQKHASPQLAPMQEHSQINSRPGYEHPQNYAPQQYSPQTQQYPERRRRKTEQPESQTPKIVAIVVVVALVAVSLVAGGYYFIENRTDQNDDSRTARERRTEPEDWFGRKPAVRDQKDDQKHAVKINVLGDFSHLNVYVPQNYYILDPNEIGLAENLLKPGQNDLKEYMELTGEQKEQEILLFMAIKNFANEPTARNPSIAIAAISVGSLSNARTSRDFLMAINRERASLPGNGFRTAQIEENQDLGNLKTLTMESSELEDGVTVTTKVIVTRINDFFLGVTISYSSQSELYELESIVRSIQGLR